MDERFANSPMTELSIDLELSSVSTPRRRLSLDYGTPTPKRASSVTESVESGIMMDSPLLECPSFESPVMEIIRTRNNKLAACSSMRQRLMVRRSFSSPNTASNVLEPLPFNNSDSTFMPIEVAENIEENHSDLSLCEMSDEFPDLETDFEIRRRKASGRSNSAPPGTIGMFTDNYSSDDGFFDEISPEYLSSSPTNIPPTFIGLMDAPLVSKYANSEEDKENAPNFLQRNNTFQKPTGVPLNRNRSQSFSIKRDKPADGSSPVSRKKHRSWICRSNSLYETDPALTPLEKRLTDNKGPVRTLQRSQSFDTHSTKSPSVEITSLFDMDDKKMIGDRSREYSLPITKSKHLDLKGITPETLANMMDNVYQDVIDEYYIIDCRYPYEYDGGHIKGAINIYEKQETVRQFLKSPKIKNGKRIVLVFHCEFSSKRGPEMSRFLRNKDRDIHQHCYPNLYYPEMYILEGGYKEFFNQKKEYCTPESYQEMADPNFAQDLKKFSKRSKSWTEDKSGRKRTGLRY
ncbi:M-phase inducer phosphatase 1 isoform X2 [Hydra vulgaris]|uniref:M-phase inducer phosphatase n=1 Tax=Hydra vulgaris TaxID=6087 RepID=A0ABM4BLP8_HYDVU